MGVPFVLSRLCFHRRPYRYAAAADCRPALIYAHRMERFARHAFWLVPLYLVSVGLGYLGDDSVDRSLGGDLVTAAIVIGVGTRLWLRLPRVRESTERTRAVARPVEVAPPTATWGDRPP